MTFAAFRRQPVANAARSVSHLQSIPAPIKGWVTAASLVNAKPGQALVLENLFPTQTGIKPRAGRALKATIGTVAVERVFHYSSGIVNKLFAADATKIFDITAPGSPTVPPAASVSGQTSGYYSDALFTTSGGTYLVVVNGANDMQQFDGSTWNQMNSGSTPAITVFPTNVLESVWVYKSRLFFTVGGTLNIQYLPIDSIAGAMGQKSLGGIFQNGGALVFGATWSFDAGNGLQEYCVLFTDKGEMAVFSGSNPAGAAVGDFDLVGRYDVSIPMGKNGTMRAGADLLVLTQDGVVPVSEALKKDVAALSISAVSKAIEPDWQVQVRARGGTPWEIVKWPSHNMAVISVPAAATGDATYCYVVNVETGAWCTYTNWDVRSLDVFVDRLYFGTRDGKIWEGETGGSDGGGNIYCTYVGHADHLNSPGVEKTVLSMRSTFKSSVSFTPKLSCSTDYKINVPNPPSVAPVSGEGWDLSLWDVGTWDAIAATVMVATRWVSIGATGFAVNLQLQVTSNATVPLLVELVALDVLYETGGTMV